MSDLTDLTTRCIRCGFCLEACPTFVLDGDESRSPRGRISLSQQAQDGQISWEEIRTPLETCLGCRACETACPSGVEYGKILELALENLPVKTQRKVFLRVISDPPLGKAMSLAGAMAGLPKMPSIFGLSKDHGQASPPPIQARAEWEPLDARKLVPVKGEVYLLKGCVAGTIFPRVEDAVRRLLRRVGYVVKETPTRCCGALLAHSGLHHDAEVKARELAESLPGDLPLIVHTAGCGSTLKQYEVLGQPGLAKRTQDISEFLFQNGLGDLLAKSSGLPNIKATYHDACHLAHGQKIRTQPRTLLGSISGVEWVDLKESDMCCGSAGTYNLFEPTTARRLLDRKWANIEATGAQVVVQGNAGCHAWIEQAAREHGGRVLVMHTAEFLESSFSGLP